MFCPNCGESIKEGAAKCPKCDQWLIPRPAQGESKLNWKLFFLQLVVLLLFIFVGVPAALFGGCILLFGFSGPNKFLVLDGLGLFAVSGLLLWVLLRVNKMRR